jgi:hypothetical protein
LIRISSPSRTCLRYALNRSFKSATLTVRMAPSRTLDVMAIIAIFDPRGNRALGNTPVIGSSLIAGSRLLKYVLPISRRTSAIVTLQGTGRVGANSGRQVTPSRVHIGILPCGQRMSRRGRSIGLSVWKLYPSCPLLPYVYIQSQRC